MNSLKLLSLSKSENEITEVVLINIVKMLTERKLLNKSQLNINIKNITSLKPIDNIYKIKINENDEVIIKIFKHSITSISKTTEVGGFLINNKNKKCIVVVSNLNKKVKQSIKKHFPLTEIFKESDLMINLVDHVYIPKHIVLDEKQKKEFYEKYSINKSKSSSMFEDDPIAKYFNLSIGDVCKIFRPSETGNITIGYRVVVRGSIN